MVVGLMVVGLMVVGPMVVGLMVVGLMVVGPNNGNAQLSKHYTFFLSEPVSSILIYILWLLFCSIGLEEPRLRRPPISQVLCYIIYFFIMNGDI